ncbi:hypothetical protein [Spirosoma litoris]
MATYTYQSHRQQTTPGTAFTEGNNGHYWLAGASGKQIEVLLKRLSDVLSKPTAPTAEQIDQTLNDYWEWFRDAYQQSKGDECPYSDDQITESVGLAWLTTQGKATLFSSGNFRFCIITNDQLLPQGQGYQQVQLSTNSLLIADPSRVDIALQVVEEYRKSENQWESITQKTYTYPVAVVQAVAVTQTPPDNGDKSTEKIPITALLGVLTIVAGLLVGWYYFIGPMVQQQPTSDTTTAISSTTTSTPVVVDSSKIDNPVQAQSLPKPVENKIQQKDKSTSSETRPESNKPATEPTHVKPTPAQTQPTALRPAKQQGQPDPAGDYLEAGHKAFAKAEKLRAAGNPDQAIQQYEVALASFNRFSALRPEGKAAVAKLIATCNASLTTLKSTPSF